MTIAERMVAAITEKDIDAFGNLYVDEAVMHEPLLPEPAIGRKEIMAGEAALFSAFSDIAVDIRNVVSAGPSVIAEVVLRATNDGPLDLGVGEIPPTGRSIEVPMAWSFKLDDAGLIVEERDYFDTSLIMQQLGLDEGA